MVGFPAMWQVNLSLSVTDQSTMTAALQQCFGTYQI
jgi:hypothetical protein